MQFLRSPAAALDRIVHARASLVALFGFAYLEAAFLPVPIEAVTAPYMQMRRDILWLIAAVALGGYVAAALTGYGIGALLLRGGRRRRWSPASAGRRGVAEAEALRRPTTASGR